MNMNTNGAAPPAAGNTITDLRAAIFQTIEAVRTGAIEIDRAKQIAELARVLVDTAKVEVDYLRVTDDANHTGFLTQQQPNQLPGRR